MANVEEGKIIKYQQSFRSPAHGYWGTFVIEALFPDRNIMNQEIIDALNGKPLKELVTITTQSFENLAYDPTLKIRVPKDRFKGTEELKKGMVFRARIDQKLYTGVVDEINDTDIVMDCNPPWYAHNLTLGLYVLEIRTPDENEAENFKARIRIND